MWKEREESECRVIIVGAGPSGLATAACLSVLSIPYVVLERDDCIASLWRHRAYDRLSLHLAKRFCELPHLPHPAAAPTYIPKDRFLRYLDDYASRFRIAPRLRSEVLSAAREAGGRGRWVVEVNNPDKGDASSKFIGGFLVVATGENGEPYLPEFKGLGSFPGTVIHSSQYKSGGTFRGKNVLVVGSGNSGMEIAFDLCNHGALPSLSVRSEFHVASREIIHLGMLLLKYRLPLFLVDKIVLALCRFKYGDLSKYGIIRPREGIFFLKATKGRSAVIDVGTVKKIRTGEIQVLPGVSTIEGDRVVFSNGLSRFFDAIIFATGYRSVANNWLKDDGHLLNDKGLPTRRFPNHWKGDNGVYCVGLGSRGLDGISSDAKLVANDIDMVLKAKASMAKFNKGD